MDFGELLKAERTRKSESLRNLGEKTGMSYSYISQIERGERSAPSAEKVKSLAKALAPGDKSLEAHFLKSAGFKSKEEVDQIFFQEELRKRVEKETAIKNGTVAISEATGEYEAIENPYYNLDWLLTQSDHKVMYGYDHEFRTDKDGNEKKVFKNLLTDEDKKIIHGIIQSYLFNRHGMK